MYILAGSDDFPYCDDLARRDVYSIMWRPRMTVLAHDQGIAPLAWVFGFKAYAQKIIAQILPEPQASLLSGILLGNDSGISQDMQAAFRGTSTAHIIAISG